MAWEDAITNEDVYDLLDALSIAAEYLGERSDPADVYSKDYTTEDREEMRAKLRRLNKLYNGLVELTDAPEAQPRSWTSPHTRTVTNAVEAGGGNQ